MTLQRLLDTAFRRGCGISMGYAQSTPRYAELLTGESTVKVETPEEFALIRYLGEQLADRAAHNLPAKIKHSLHLWGEGLEAQHELLDIVMENLNSDNWRKRRKGKRLRKYSSRDTVLPAVTKSWARGPLQPNCLGAAQLLVGFARLVGARHYVVNVLVTNEERNARNDNELFVWLDDKLVKHGNGREITAIRKVLAKNRQVALMQLNKLQERQAHHALAIELVDGSWMIVDPYLGVMHQLYRFKTKRLQTKLGLINRNPTRTVMLAGGLMDVKERQIANRKAAILESAILFMLETRRKAYEHPESELEIESAAWVAARHYAGLAKGQAQDVTKQQNYDFNYLYNLLLMYAYVPPKRRKSFIDDVWGKAKAKQPPIAGLREEFERYRVAVLKDKRRRDRAYPRMAQCLVKVLLDELRATARAHEGARHMSIEVADPATMLGCATLNHLRVRTGTYVHGRLSVYTSSQWVLLDTLSAQNRGDIPDAESEKIILAQQARMHKADPRLVLTALHNLEGE